MDQREAADFCELLGVALDCSEEDLKRAYKRFIFRFHPDRRMHTSSNEHYDIQWVTSAYSALLEYRQTANSTSNSPHLSNSAVPLRETIRREIKDQRVLIARLRSRWRAEHHADRHDLRAFFELLDAASALDRMDQLSSQAASRFNIDNAAVAFFLMHPHTARRSLYAWAEHLWSRSMPLAAIDVMSTLIDYSDGNPASTRLIVQEPSDTHRTSTAITPHQEQPLPIRAYAPTNERLKRRLASYYYYYGRYGATSRSEKRPVSPEHTIAYLRLSAETGQKTHFVSKCLAEAYWAKGDEAAAWNHLSDAVQMMPNLTGAKRLLARLRARIDGGRLVRKSAAPSTPAPETSTNPGYHLSDKRNQVLPPRLVLEFAAEGNWGVLLEHASHNSYARRVTSQAQFSILHIVRLLAFSGNPAAIKALHSAATESPWWEVQLAAMTSLSRIASPASIAALVSLDGAQSGYFSSHRWGCLRYSVLRAAGDFSKIRHSEKRAVEVATRLVWCAGTPIRGNAFTLEAAVAAWLLESSGHLPIFDFLSVHDPQRQHSPSKIARVLDNAMQHAQRPEDVQELSALRELARAAYNGTLLKRFTKGHQALGRTHEALPAHAQLCYAEVSQRLGDQPLALAHVYQAMEKLPDSKLLSHVLARFSTVGGGLLPRRTYADNYLERDILNLAGFCRAGLEAEPSLHRALHFIKRAVVPTLAAFGRTELLAKLVRISEAYLGGSQWELHTHASRLLTVRHPLEPTAAVESALSSIEGLLREKFLPLIQQAFEPEHLLPV